MDCRLRLLVKQGTQVALVPVHRSLQVLVWRLGLLRWALLWDCEAHSMRYVKSTLIGTEFSTYDAEDGDMMEYALVVVFVVQHSRSLKIY
jgi:hypothetical protein